MKYRTDFVTNSSSSSFAAAAVTSLAGILAACNCTDAQTDETEDEQSTLDDPIFLQKTTMPDDELKLVAGGEPVYLYAQLCETIEGETTILDEPTSAIEFQISTGGGWVTLGAKELVGGWTAVEVTGVSSESSTTPPQMIKIKAKCGYQKKRYTATFRIPFEAESQLVVAPNDCNFLTKTEASFDFDVTVKNPGAEPWVLSEEADSWAAKICNWQLKDISETGDKATLSVTECDTEEVTGRGTNYYSSGKITLTARSGEKEISDYGTIFVWREGLFIVESGSLDMDRETGEIIVKADVGDDGNMRPSIFDLRYLRWNEQEKRSTSQADIFADEDIFSLSGPEPLDAGAEAIFETLQAPVEYLGVRPSNMPTGKFQIAMDKIIPGKRGERFHFTLTATVDDGVDYFDVTIPFAIVPAFISEGQASWQQEYDYCKKIITKFFPPSRRDTKLLELENCKHYMGAADLKQYRKETWDIAYDIIMKQKADYEAEAAWYDNAVYVAEWIQWLNDRAFNVVLGTLTGPMGAIVVGQCKELMQDLIAKYIEAKATDTWMKICKDLLYNRFSGTLGGSLDAKYFSDPELSKKWIAMFFMYKWAYHWAFDYEKEERKGCLEGLRSACWDLAAAGLEEKLKPFIGEMASEGGFKQNMDIDDYITKTIDGIKPYLAKFMASSFVQDERGSS